VLLCFAEHAEDWSARQGGYGRAPLSTGVTAPYPPGDAPAIRAFPTGTWSERSRSAWADTRPPWSPDHDLRADEQAARADRTTRRTCCSSYDRRERATKAGSGSVARCSASA